MNVSDLIKGVQQAGLIIERILIKHRVCAGFKSTHDSGKRLHA
jgi:hypothetical protein